MAELPENRLPGFERARDTFRRAALEVPAYADFLRRNNVAAERIRTPQDFARVPPVTKANYLHHYPLSMLARGGDITEAGIWSTSSGSSGKPTYWPRGSLSLEQSIDLYDNIFRQSFRSHERSTLTVIGFAIVPRRTSEITVRFHGGVRPGDDAACSLAAARRRRTNRGPYLSSLPPGAAAGLRAVPCEPATSLTLIDDMAGRSVAADLAARAMHVLFSVPELRRDLAPFVFTGADEPRQTGMPIESLNPAMTAGVPGRQWVLEMASADEEAEAARARFEKAPLHFVVSSRTDTLPGWIAGGRTLQRVLVTATALGLSHCLAAGPSEIPTLLPALRRLASDREGRPLILGRLGVPSRPDQAIASPRRAVADILSC
jgi:hypothetical protein